MIAVCLLTADRAEYTARTLGSFTRHNVGREDVVLLHADDGSSDSTNNALAAEFGFRTIYASKERKGQGPALLAMWLFARSLGADRILHLENDWEWVAPFPADVSGPCVRLYGARKERGDGPRAAAGTRDLGTGQVVEWTPVFPGWELGVTHWGGPPSITRTELLLRAAIGARRIKDITTRLSLPTLRPVENIVWHIGDAVTPRAVA